MESIETIRAFFGWSIIVHAVVITIVFGAITLGGELVRGMHGRMFGLDDEDLSRTYFQFLALYKLGIWMFAIVPWAALHLIA